ncbi:hypothetical protein D9C73_028590 [Collichthys lucidus]|uniref:Uncharacterized protein n=1 Tax=Collichthys lucidus TaxID=240159 RepID=A0A4U5TWX3_COLLU|nr:hypothetical protein D9C73_028590 [Collichthys lucidus]
MCRSFHRASDVDQSITSSRFSSVFPCLYREIRSGGPSGAEPPPGGDPARRAATTTPEPGCVFSGNQSPDPGRVCAGCSVSEVCFPGWAAPDVRWICRHSPAPLSLRRPITARQGSRDAL